jgi:two-component system sensor histidine kinase TctE
LLNTQLDYAARSTEVIGRDESLIAAQKTLRSATRLVNQLLALSSAHALTPGEKGDVELSCSLVATAKQVLESLAGSAQSKRIDLGLEAPEAHSFVSARPVVLREMVMNLVDNAIRYTQRGGRVTVAIDARKSGICLSVTDNGPGIAPEFRELVFDRFFRIHDLDSQGSGLGLAIVREFAEKIGAKVGLSEPKDSQGLCVTLEFPTRN